jgi:hypothetical protein
VSSGWLLLLRIAVGHRHCRDISQRAQAHAATEILELQPAFERGSNLAYDASIELSWGFTDEFGELHRLML